MHAVHCQLAMLKHFKEMNSNVETAVVKRGQKHTSHISVADLAPWPAKLMPGHRSMRAIIINGATHCQQQLH